MLSGLSSKILIIHNEPIDFLYKFRFGKENPSDPIGFTGDEGIHFPALEMVPSCVGFDLIFILNDNSMFHRAQGYV